MLTFLRSLFADSCRTSPAPRRARLGLEGLDGRIVPAAPVIDTPPILVDTVESDGPIQAPTPGQAPTQAPTQNPNQAPTQTPTQDQAPTQAPVQNPNQAPTQTPLP
jgi:hypothetical protein